MKNFFIYLIIVLIFSQQLAQSQEIKDKNVLIVWGGWEGHNPKLFSDIVEKWLIKNNANVTVSNSLNTYSNFEYLMKCDIINQCVTMGEITIQKEKKLTKNYRIANNAEYNFINFFINSVNEQLDKNIFKNKTIVSRYHGHKNKENISEIFLLKS